MKYNVNAIACRSYRCRIDYRSLDKAEGLSAFTREEALHGFARTRAEVVYSDDLLAHVEQSIHQVTTNEPGAARYKPP
jgi:hypothetical protein